MPVTVTKDRVPDVLKAVQALTKSRLLIGIPAENAERESVPGQEDGPNNAVIGYLNETGAPERNLPARPHLVPGVESIADKAIARLKVAGQKALDGDKEAVEKAFMAIGLMGVSAVRGQIEQTLSPPLSPKTLYRRKHRKIAPRTGEQPLLDTGAYKNAISYVIRVRGQ